MINVSEAIQNGPGCDCVRTIQKIGLLHEQFKPCHNCISALSPLNNVNHINREIKHRIHSSQHGGV